MSDGVFTVIDHFHYDVTHAKVSGSCSKDCAQGRSIAGKFKIIHKNTCNAMAATSIMCITERTSSDISVKPAFAPPGQSRDNNVKVRKLFFARFSSFFNRFALGALQNFFNGWLLVRSIFRPVILHASLGWSFLKAFLLKVCCYKEKTWRILDGGYRRH